MIRKLFLLGGLLMAFAAIAVFVKGAGVVLAAAPSAQNATCDWLGGSGDWHDASKWSCGVVPTADDDVTIGTSLLLGTITLSQTAPMKSLSINTNGGVISGTGALNVSGLMTVSAFAELKINTNGSRVAQLQSSAASGAAIRFTDAALTADSFRALSITSQGNGSTVLTVGERSVGKLLVVGNFTTNSNMTVTEVFSLAGSLSSGFNNVATLTLASNALMTMTSGASFYMPFVNNGAVTWLGTQGVSAQTDARWINNGTLDIRAAENDGSIIFGGQGLPFMNASSGVVRVNISSEVQWSWAFENRGLVEINSGSVRSDGNSYTQYGGHTQFNGGGMAGIPKCCNLDNYPIYLYGGTLGGSGLITGGVENRGGTLLLDGVMRMTNSYVQSISGTLQVTLTNSTEPVRLNVLKRTGLNGNGAILIDGTLIVNKASGFSPKSGDRFVIGVAALNAQGAFQQSIGNMAPAFSGYAGGGQLIVAEANNAVLVQAKPDRVKSNRGEENGYTIALVNPTTQTLQVSRVEVSMPISFTYKAGSSTGVYTNTPSDFEQNGRRILSFFGSVTLAARERKEFHFGVVVGNNTPSGSYSINVETTLNGLVNPLKLMDVAAIDVPFYTASGVGIGVSGGHVITQGDTVNIMIRGSHGQINTSVISIRVGIDCPPEFVPCGNLRDVYVGQKVNGRYINIIKLTKEVVGNSPEAQYGFWKGFIPGAQFYPGVPEKLFPDWDPHRPCIAYDYGGGGGKPLGCVDGGDDLGTPQLYDPSGVIRDASTNQPISNATVTLYRLPSALPDTPTQTKDCRTLDTRGGSVWTGTASGGLFEQPGFTPAQISPNVNPQITGADGRYGWNVVTGCWYVTVSAPGYIPKTSALVGVPPEVTDLDIDLVAGEVPKRLVFLPVMRK